MTSTSPSLPARLAASSMSISPGILTVSGWLFLFFKTALENLPILLRDAPDIDFFGYTENRMPDIQPDVLCHRMSFVTGYLESFEFFISPSSNCFLIKKRIFALSTKLYFFLSIKKTLNISCKFLVSCFK